MLLVMTRLGVSRVHHIGLFADQFIPRGTITWEYSSEFDATYSDAEIARMSAPARAQFLRYSYFDKDLGLYVLCFDDQRFINHCSDDPNIAASPRRDTAARDIQKGEELVCDYNCFDDTYFTRLGLSERDFLLCRG